jgi:hypothetical protein
MRQVRHMNLWDLLMGCTHRHLSRVWTFPVTVGRGFRMGRKRSYKVCLTCGAELPYNLDQMRLETPQERRQRAKEALA